MKTHEVATTTVRTMFDTMDVPVSAKQMSQVLLDEVLERFDAPLESFPFMPNYYQIGRLRVSISIERSDNKRS